MGRVSKFKLRDKELQELSEHFSQLVSALKEKHEIENFLSQFFTREEKIMVTKRLMLFLMLKKGYSVEAIQASLHLSYETVRSYSHQIVDKNELFHKTLEKLLREEQARVFWQKVDALLKPLELALQAKTNMKARAKLMSGDY